MIFLSHIQNSLLSISIQLLPPIEKSTRNQKMEYN